MKDKQKEFEELVKRFLDKTMPKGFATRCPCCREWIDINIEEMDVKKL